MSVEATPGDTALPLDLAARADALRPTLLERADEIEAARRLPRDLSDTFAEAGFYRMLVPEVYGGLELPPWELVRTVESLARGDGSSAWCAFIAATSGTVLSLLDPATAREIFSKPETLLGGVFAPMGRAERTDAGLQVNGRWAWGSGTQNADWVMGGCRFLRDGEPELDKHGRPLARMVLVPASQIHFLDTWHVSGMCGTGSTDFEMRDLCVEERFAAGLGLSGPVIERPLYAFPQFGILALGIAGVTLGLAQAGIDALVELADAKRPQGSRRTLAERSKTQSDVAQAHALVRASRSWLEETVESAWEVACASGAIPVTERRDLRLATAHAVECSARAVDLVYHLGGGTSVYRRSPLQRIFRDVHVATQHAMVAPSIFEVGGRHLLGMETDASQL